LDFAKLNPRSRRTAVSLGEVEIETVEHMMSALCALRIDNIVIEVDQGEFPGLDGSAKGFVEALEDAGFKEYDAPQKVLRLEEPVWVEDERSFLGVFPSERFKVSYTLAHDRPRVLEGFYSVEVTEENFKHQIAPARTFCFEEEARELLKTGFGKGANYENTLVLGKDGPIRNTYRFPDEPVRHKILDLIGDLYLVGCQVRGRVIAVKSGHALNMELVRKLKMQGEPVTAFGNG
jgi:UDP-3-O-acyl N-acetylglucosamine deacetylase